jgi:ferredoxin
LPQVTIISRRLTVTHEIRRGLGFLALAEKHPVPIEFDCRAADCGICIVKVEAGAENLGPKTEEEADFLKAMAAAPDERLACQCRIMGDVTVRVDEP